MESEIGCNLQLQLSNREKTIIHTIHSVYRGAPINAINMKTHTLLSLNPAIRP
jgi:hypothetical protein